MSKIEFEDTPILLMADAEDETNETPDTEEDVATPLVEDEDDDEDEDEVDDGDEDETDDEDEGDE